MEAIHNKLTWFPLKVIQCFEVLQCITYTYTHTHTHTHPFTHTLLLLHLEPHIRGNKTDILENRSPVHVCVDLRGATQSTSQNLTITFTPQLKPSTKSQATRKNL